MMLQLDIFLDFSLPYRDHRSVRVVKRHPPEAAARHQLKGSLLPSYVHLLHAGTGSCMGREGAFLLHDTEISPLDVSLQCRTSSSGISFSEFSIQWEAFLCFPIWHLL